MLGRYTDRRQPLPKSCGCVRGEASRRAGFSLRGRGNWAEGVRDGTIDGDFRWLSSVFNWARKHKIEGRRVLNTNPLHDLKWPKEINVRRPVASHQRFEATMKQVNAVDPAGRLGCMLSLARYTGRRESAICNLRVCDILRTESSIREALAGLGMDESWAQLPHGTIRWREEHDKQGFDAIAPMSAIARQAIDHYLSGSLRMGEAWLFPSPGDDSKPMRRDLAGKWLIKAERAAELPKLNGGRWHPYRRLWATERKHLSDTDVAAAGGWRDTRALKLSYQQADPATVLRVVEGGA